MSKSCQICEIRDGKEHQYCNEFVAIWRDVPPDASIDFITTENEEKKLRFSFYKHEGKTCKLFFNFIKRRNWVDRFLNDDDFRTSFIKYKTVYVPKKLCQCCN